MKFKRLIEYWNNDDECGVYPTDVETVAVVAKFFVRASLAAIKDVLFRKQEHYLRVSSLGKPLIILCLAKIGYREPDNIPFKLRWIFMVGHIFEAFLMCVLHLLKYDIHSPQKEIEFMGCVGHIDFMVDDFVIEVKSMSDTYFRQFTAKQNDDRGYLTQLHVYCHALRTKKGIFLVINKSTNEIREVPLIWDDRILKRAASVIHHYNKCDSIDYIIDNISAPECVPEKRGNTLTGNFLVPPSMRYSYFKDAFYHWDGKTATYIPYWYRSFE